MASIFSKIISGEIPSYKIAEDKDNYAFLDIGPVKEGHVLVVPKVEQDYIFDLTEDQLSSLILFSQKIAKAIKHCIDCNRVGITVIGLEVPHAHIHLIPIDHLDDMNFMKPKLKLAKEEMQAVATKIQIAFNSLFPD